MNRPNSLAFIALATSFSFACAACTDLQSADLKTAGMSANMTVQGSSAGQATVNVVLNVDNNATDFVTLSSGDALVAKAGSASQTLSESNTLGDVSYATTFGNEASGTLFTVALNRSAGSTSAPSSTCTLPAPFAISTPSSTTSFSRASSDIVVTYGPGGSSDAVSYVVEGSCVGGSGPVTLQGDPGSFTIARGSVTPLGASQTNASCAANISISRTRTGQLDPAFVRFRWIHPVHPASEPDDPIDAVAIARQAPGKASARGRFRGRRAPGRSPDLDRSEG